MSTIAFNPVVTTTARGSFNTQSQGWIQGTALNDPSARNYLAGGVLAATETLPMWGGVAITENIPGSTPNPALGGSVGRATLISTTGAAGALTGFSVFDQAVGMVNTPQSEVPLAGSGMGVNFYRLGSGARIAVACAAGLVALDGSPITQQVSWDFDNQLLVPYAPAYNDVTITGATWASTAGGQATFTVSTDLTSILNAGDSIYATGVVSTGATTDGYNGRWIVVSVTSSTVVVTMARAATPGTYASGGTIQSGGGALPVKVLEFNIGNSMTVDYAAATGFATWNRSGNAAIILI